MKLEEKKNTQTDLFFTLNFHTDQIFESSFPHVAKPVSWAAQQTGFWT